MKINRITHKCKTMHGLGGRRTYRHNQGAIALTLFLLSYICYYPTYRPRPFSSPSPSPDRFLHPPPSNKNNPPERLFLPRLIRFLRRFSFLKISRRNAAPPGEGWFLVVVYTWERERGPRKCLEAGRARPIDSERG